MRRRETALSKICACRDVIGLATVLVPQTWVIKPTMQPFGGRLSPSAPIERGRGMGEIWETECFCVSSGETESAESTGRSVRLVPTFAVYFSSCVNHFETRKHSSRQRKSRLRCGFSCTILGLLFIRLKHKGATISRLSPFRTPVRRLAVVRKAVFTQRLAGFYPVLQGTWRSDLLTECWTTQTEFLESVFGAPGDHQNAQFLCRKLFYLKFYTLFSSFLSCVYFYFFQINPESTP